MAAGRRVGVIRDGQDEAFGAKADTAAATDTGTYTYMAFIKRLLAKLTTGIPITGYLGTATIAAGQATAGSASGALVAARATRRRVTLYNGHATDVLYVGAGTVSTANGLAVKAGTSVTLETVAAVNGIRGASADITVSFIEEYG